MSITTVSSRDQNFLGVVLVTQHSNILYAPDEGNNSVWPHVRLRDQKQEPFDQKESIGMFIPKDN